VKEVSINIMNMTYTLMQACNTLRINVKAYNAKACTGKFRCQWQTHIPETNDTNHCITRL